MKKKQVLAVSSALMIGTTTALTGLPTPAMAQENTEVVQEAVVEENKTEQVPVEQETENAEAQENMADKERKETVTEDKTVEESKNAEIEAGSIAIDEAHFPDAEFRKYISDIGDVNHDGTLSEEERKNVEKIDIINNPTLKSLKGIEYFPNVWQIDCHNTGLTDLDVSKNEKLSWLWCGDTAIKSLEIQNNPKLETLICRGCNNLEILIIENTPLLEELDCQDTNIKDLDVSNFSVLNTLDCSNTKITTLDVTHNPALRYLECAGNNLDTLDISQNPHLYFLNCYNNNLQLLDISNNPEIALLSCGKNKLSILDVSKQTHLTQFDCENNLLTTLDVTHNPELKSFDCSDNLIQALDISKNLELETLYVRDTNIAGLDVSNNTKLKYLSYTDKNSYYPTWLNIGNKSNLKLYKNSLVERELNLTGNTFDLRKNTDSNIDLSKVIITSNGTLDKNTGIVTVEDTSKDVSYEYNCGTNNGEQVFLNVTFKLNGDTPTNTAPTISAKDVTLNIGDTFDPLSEVTATDKEDGAITLTKDNVIANDVDTSKAGTYHVTYKVTDKNGASSEKTITVTVKQNTANINSAPTISVNDITLNVGDTFDPLSEVTATDKEDGAITLTKDNVIANDVDTSKAGTYHVTYKVTDKNGASAEKTITVTVKEQPTNKPVSPQQPQKPNKPTTPTKPNGQRSPVKTGDMTNVGLFASMFAGSTGALAVLFGKKRKRNKND